MSQDSLVSRLKGVPSLSVSIDGKRVAYYGRTEVETRRVRKKSNELLGKYMFEVGKGGLLVIGDVPAGKTSFIHIQPFNAQEEITGMGGPLGSAVLRNYQKGRLVLDAKDTSFIIHPKGMDQNIAETKSLLKYLHSD